MPFWYWLYIWLCRRLGLIKARVVFPGGSNVATITVQQKVTAHWQELDPQGNVVPPTGQVSWSVPDGTVVTLAPSSDTYSVVVTPVAPGDVTITATGDSLTATASLTVTDVAVSARIFFDPPVSM